jgi:RNA-binding protein YhbY
MFFLFGSPRTGTTLLKEVLNLNAKIYILNETDFIGLTAQVIHNIDDAVQGKEIIYKIIINSNLRSSLTKFLTNEKIYELVNKSEYNFFDIID